MAIYNMFLDVNDGGWVLRDLIAGFESREDAESFVNRYADAFRKEEAGYLVVEESNIVSHSEYPSWKPDKKWFWWLD